jgi:hypothetical protein
VDNTLYNALNNNHHHHHGPWSFPPISSVKKGYCCNFGLFTTHGLGLPPPLPLPKNNWKMLEKPMLSSLD